MADLKSILDRIRIKLIGFQKDIFLFRIGGFLRIFKKKPVPSFEKILIHIGCGDLNDKRYINVDTRKGWHINYVEKIENCFDIFPKDYADLIYACHVLEHVSYQKTLKTLIDLKKILKKKGILRISVPNFDTIIEMYKEKNSVKDIMPPLMGGQNYQGNYHFSIFNEKYLKNLLFQAGFSEVRIWNPDKAEFHSFNDWSRKKIRLYKKEWPISLNIEAIK